MAGSGLKGEPRRGKSGGAVGAGGSVGGPSPLAFEFFRDERGDVPIKS